MQFPTNKPIVLATEATTFNSVTVTAAPDPATYAGPLTKTGSLVINDCATLAAANPSNVLWECPFEALFRNVLYHGRVAGGGATAHGLVVSEVPPGVAIIVDFGS